MMAFNEHGILPSVFCSLSIEDKAAIWAFMEYKAQTEKEAVENARKETK
jgi:hypothetical protein|nr:MAG TPA: hypothetical protein [Caudoviricetes sp.]